MTWFLASTPILYHKKHKAQTGVNRLTHQYKYTLTPRVRCSKQLSVLHWMNNLLISKIYLTEFHNVVAFQKLLTIEVTIC